MTEEMRSKNGEHAKVDVGKRDTGRREKEERDKEGKKEGEER